MPTSFTRWLSRTGHFTSVRSATIPTGREIFIVRYHSQTAATRSRILGRRSIVQEASTKLSVPEDERMMLLAASRRSDSLGDFDLYVSQKQPAGKWGEPVNLGPEINTAARELSPKLAPNGKYLVWMSCRLPALSPKTPNSDDS